MHRLGRFFAAGLVAVWACGQAVSASAAVAKEGEPVYRQVRAERVRPRGGMPNVLAKLAAGKDVAIGYLGGSITAQAGWRVMTRTWFQEAYPKAKVREINAAIGGTPSRLGAFRVGQDVLRHKPDLVFVEFAVNDQGMSPQAIWRAMEGIVRQIWRQDATTDICYVYTIHTKTMPAEYLKGLCPRSTSAMELLADHYGIPSINVAQRVVELHEAGKLAYKAARDPKTSRPLPAPAGTILFANDDCHPRPEGHKVYTDVIAEAVKSMASLGRPGPHELKTPFVRDHWGDAKIVPLAPSMLSAGWKKLPADAGLGRRFAKYMPELWEATRPGEKITFRVRGSMVMLYDLLGPDGGQAIVTVDGRRRARPVKRFDRYCSYHRIATLSIASNLDPAKVHTVEVEIHPEQPDRSSVVDREKAKKNFDPKKYDGTRMRVGGILLIGQLAGH